MSYFRTFVFYGFMKEVYFPWEVLSIVLEIVLHIHTSQKPVKAPLMLMHYGKILPAGVVSRQYST